MKKRMETNYADIRNRLREFWRRYKRNRIAVFGLSATSILCLIGLFAPWISPYDPLSPQFPQFLRPSASHLMGTDDLGKDILSGVIHGIRISLLVGFVAAGTATVIGAILGSISGYVGGLLDDILMRIADVMTVIPRFFLALVLVVLLGPSIWNVIWVIAFLTWPSTARLTRAEFLSLKRRQFVEALKSIGVGKMRIIFSEIFPNATPPIIVNASILMASAILMEAGLSFLGLGDPNVVSLGLMLNSAQKYYSFAWWMVFFPGVAMFLAVLGLNLLGDGLNDALNPRLKES